MKSILVIDDSEDFLTLLKVFFSNLQYRVIASATVPTLDRVQQIAPSVILLDYQVGDQLGSDLCVKLKRQPGTSHIPIIMMSANTGVRQISVESCADAFIEKPFDITKLFQLICQIREGSSGANGKAAQPLGSRAD